jgi:N-acetylglucosamine-6-phosphate deacetylase
MSTIYLHNGTVYTGITALPKSTVIVKDGKIEDVISERRFRQREIEKDAKIYYLNGATISPGFIDTHIHGVHGFDTSDGTPEAILEMSAALPEYGVAGFCPTLYPQKDADFLKSIDAVVAAVGKEPGAKIWGMHLEGPFISPHQKGALAPEFMKSVDLNVMETYVEHAKGQIAIMTVAPELKKMRDLALYCTKKGIVLSAGHSDASYENMMEGIQAGILHSTHFFNAMRPSHHRDPGVVGAIMIHPNVSCEIIGDGYHVHPAFIKLLMRDKPSDKIILVTDALRPTGQKEGKMIANNEEVYFNNGLFVRKIDGTIAGSALTMIKGVKNLFEMGIPLDDVLRMASTNPASLLGRQRETGFLLPGKDADIVVFDEEFNIILTMVNGEIKKFED